MRIAVDTNVLGYAEGLDDEDRRTRANEVLLALRRHDMVMPLQRVQALKKKLETQN